MHILLTNDDGIDSPGLLALRDALSMVGRVSVVAPDRNQSGVGRAISISADLVVTERELPDGTGLAVSGTPVDCVRMAHLGLVEGPIDAVVAGINLGQNLGDDTTYSGTVGAALEGALLGLPSVGVSQRIGGIWSDDMLATTDFTSTADFAAGLLSDLAPTDFSPGMALNINAPRTEPGAPRGARLTTLTSCVYRDELDLVKTDATGRHYRIYGRAPQYLAEDGSDAAALDNGEISVTPIQIGLGLPSAVPDRLAEVVAGRAPGGQA